MSISSDAKLYAHCPICGFGFPGDAVRGIELKISFEICPCCGCEYGYDDTITYRATWLSNGARWFSSDYRPAEWNLKHQLEQSDPNWFNSLSASASETLLNLGFETLCPSISSDTLTRLRSTLFTEGEAGKRCLLDEPLVREVAIALKTELIQEGFFLTPDAVAIQAIAFDKTPSANWKVAWHQDLMFPFAQAVTSNGYATPTRKDGIDYARPPVEVLEELLAVRLHLDDCDESNGPLRVSPGTHRLGILSSDAVSQTVAEHGEVVCLAKEGEALLMHPLTLHASSQATSPKHRRVLHFVYHSGAAMSETWHRRI